MNILVLCTGNSARSILLEALLNRFGAGRLKAVSAGSHPAGRVHPEALALLRAEGFEVDGLRSKSWDGFSAPGSEPVDIVITVCGNAAQACPIWPGAPVAAHWGVEDPAASAMAQQAAAFGETYRVLRLRAEALLARPFEDMTRSEVKATLDRIGTLA